MARIKKLTRQKKVAAKVVKSAATSQLLGNLKPVTKISNESNDCVNCGKVIPAARIEALQLLGTPRTQWTHTSCSTTSKIKGIYMGEVGTSKLQLCDKIYNDSVRSVFKKSTVEHDDDDGTGEERDR
jgi:hypothetical protein